MYFCFYCWISRSLNKEIKILLLLKANVKCFPPEVPEKGFFYYPKKEECLCVNILNLRSFLKFCFVLFSNQIWKILKPKWEVQCQCVKDRESSCSVASRHTLEVTSALFLLFMFIKQVSGRDPQHMCCYCFHTLPWETW